MSFNGTVTPAGPEDLDALAAVEAACFSRPWSRESLAAALADPHTLLLTARLDGTVAGYAGMQTVLDEGYIANVAVLPDHRRRGAGEALLDALVREGAQRGLAFLTLEVRVSNGPAIALYQKRGFRQAGRRRGYYEAPREDALILTYPYEKGENGKV